MKTTKKLETWVVVFGRPTDPIPDTVTLRIEAGATMLEAIAMATPLVQGGWDLVKASRVGETTEAPEPRRTHA